MADYLASIYGTEKDKVNCSFYFKIGACRHGDRCARKHIRPTFSQTVLISNVYNNPAHDPACQMTPEQVQKHFDLFWEDFFTELATYGEVEELHVCDNVSDHLIGNVYARFHSEEDAQRAAETLNNRFYAGRPLYAELSPVTDFREGVSEHGVCMWGDACGMRVGCVWLTCSCVLLCSMLSPARHGRVHARRLLQLYASQTSNSVAAPRAV